MTKNIKLAIKEFESVIKAHSNSAYIPAPKALINKRVKVIILEDE